MKKNEFQMLEKVWEAEISNGIGQCFTHIFQTKSKVAKKLTEEGYLREVEEVFRGVRISGYELTELGRLYYCTSCE